MPAPSGPERAQELALAAELLEIRSPAEEYRRLVQARMEALARLGEEPGGAGAGSGLAGMAGAARLDLYAAALELGLAAIERAGR
ncbi:MAG: hypothetical protein KatS3mg102_2808 [Planctomycetota bacterium]|nr:MAG: hypothetical protein KatS3mg102_2808 [Planctomycetota bacterium]